VQGLAAATERRGGVVLRGTEVLEVRSSGRGTTGVTTTAGRIDAPAVVLAAGVWTPFLAARLGLELKITPMRLQVVATDARPPMLDRLLYGPRAVRQYDLFHGLPSYREELFVQDHEELASRLPFLELACQTPAGRFLLGCPMDFSGHVWNADLAGVGMICRYLPDALPALRDARFDAAWAGLLPHTADSLPVIDRLPGHPGVFVAAGHVFGNSAALATAAAITALVREEGPPIDISAYRFGRESLAGHPEERW
jgi:glycine/D-amino acid oxidase-like deaminating enzyme